MTNLLIIVLAVITAVYVYAAIAYYYGFKSWNPFCGCTGASCAPPKETTQGFPGQTNGTVRGQH
jgi:hypothetical protein